jgi:hypothetical protein
LAEQKELIFPLKLIKLGAGNELATSVALISRRLNHALLMVVERLEKAIVNHLLKL